MIGHSNYLVELALVAPGPPYLKVEALSMSKIFVTGIYISEYLHKFATSGYILR